MPANVVKTKRDEHIWNVAKKAAHKQYPGLQQKNPTRFWTIVNGIYQKLKKQKSKK